MSETLNLSDYENLVHGALLKALEEGQHLGDIEKAGLEQLLEDDASLETVLSNRERICCVGYPKFPLYKEIARALFEWSTTSVCPYRKLPMFETFDDKYFMNEFLSLEREIFESLKGLETLWNLWKNEERVFRMQQIMSQLRHRGLLTLLGIRKTVGSVDLWPPKLSLLIQAFNAPVPKNEYLSEGARAISKHYIRDNTLRFWGHCLGNDTKKTKEANDKLCELVKIAVWINIHELPGKLPIIEIRQENGYGARWSTDGSSFRGLLEPHMVDGHEVGWKH